MTRTTYDSRWSLWVLRTPVGWEMLIVRPQGHPCVQRLDAIQLRGHRGRRPSPESAKVCESTPQAMLATEPDWVATDKQHSPGAPESVKCTWGMLFSIHFGCAAAHPQSGLPRPLPALRPRDFAVPPCTVPKEEMLQPIPSHQGKAFYIQQGSTSLLQKSCCYVGSLRSKTFSCSSEDV